MLNSSPTLPSTTSPAGRYPQPQSVPLFSLAPPALALGDALALGEPGQETNMGELWNVVTRASDLVKDGTRLENLAWRHWASRPRTRSMSTSTLRTESTTSLHTPTQENPPSPEINYNRSFERRTFGGSLKLLMDRDNFKDWVSDAKKNLPPILSVPDTPVPDVEFRLVEPTPVPSRVGSLGGSMGAGGLLGAATVPPLLTEEEEEEELDEAELKVPNLTRIDTSKSRSRSPKRKGKFFVQSSPTKSGSESSHPSPVVAVQKQDNPVIPPPQRRSSGSSSGGIVVKKKNKDDVKKRHVSLSTMRGKYGEEKRKAAAAIEAQKEIQKDEEGSGYEDEVETAEPGKDDEEGWSDEPESPEKPKRRSSSHSRSGIDLTQLVMRKSSRRNGGTRNEPPAPNTTPLEKMTKKQRAAAEAERDQIEIELDARTKREMFAKKQIFGSRNNEEGLLSGMFKRGASMVDLTAPANSRPLRPSPTHVHLPSMSHSPLAGPSLLRSKSAVAMPIQTGVSVTVSPHGVMGRSSDHSSYDKKTSSQGSARKKRAPSGVVLETSDEESAAEDNYLATSSTQRKLQELVAKKQKTQPVPQQSNGPGAEMDDPDLDESGVVKPISPKTRRRQIIVREMSESLRTNVVLERQKSSANVQRQGSFAHARPPPSMHTSHLPTRGSAVNLSQLPSLGPPLSRASSQPAISHPEHNLGTSSPSPHGPPALEPLRRRTQPNVLGGGFLRPLTRVGDTAGLNRTQSSANLSSPGSSDGPSPARSDIVYEAPAMVRRSTDGDPRESSYEARRKALAVRSEGMDTSYRTHGW
ncbi:hypothetical protein BCR39DRAFT_238711 [Naematelia encephala]|uniref:Nitrogen regulatory protein areA GATA-like domain-containing protein n=1 Tax=Naematelia encephala TaxID=71784 RepID=A0A1Y2AX76_9TREE|nr:hypothetical protein BCR39DRAFT_238711 [Naematelia encephala]